DGKLVKVFLREGAVCGYQFVGLGRRRELNQRNGFLKGLESWGHKVLQERGLGLEASGVLFHHFMRFKDRKLKESTIRALKEGMLRALANPYLDMPIF
ncbi:MAG: NAD(P)/FAD-dependent oxidoreductase, partial [Aquificaceae bacterium]